MKTETANYATERVKLQTNPVYFVRFYHVKKYGDGTEYAFSVDFSTGVVASQTVTKYAYIQSLRGSNATVIPEQGRATIGGYQIVLTDKDGDVLRWMSQGKPLTLAAGITPTTPGAGAALTFNEAPSGLPPVGTIEITTAGVIERIRYSAKNLVAKTVTVSVRGADGTTAAAHVAGDNAVNGEQIRAGQRVRIYAGYGPLAEADYMSLAKVEVVDRAMTPDGAGFVIECQDIQRALRRNVFLTRTADLPLPLTGNPLQIGLAVMLSTGVTGANHASYDFLPVEDSLGIPAALVDVAGIEAIAADFLTHPFYRFVMKGSVDFKSWWEYQILKTFNCYTIITQDGKIGIKRYKPALADGSVTETLTNADIIAWQWQAGDRQIINQVVISYDWDEPKAPGVYSRTLSYAQDTPAGTSSVDKYGRREPVVMTATGIRSSEGDVSTILDDRAAQLFKRFSDPPPILTIDVFYRKHTWEVGDPIKVTYDKIPNPVSGLRGLTNEVFEIVGIQPVWGREGRLRLTLLDVEAITIPPAPTVDAPTADDIAGTRNEPAAPGGLELVGLGNTTSFTGTDIKIAWNATAFSPSPGVGEDALSDPLDPIAEYLVFVLVGGAVVRSVPAQKASTFTYTLEMNREDNGGIAVRDVTFHVYSRTVSGRLSASPSILTVSNPAPTMTAVTPAVTRLLDALAVDWSAFDETSDPDFQKYELVFGTVSPPTTKYDDFPPGMKKVIIPNLSPSSNYFFQVKPHDVFGAGTASQITAVASPKSAGEAVGSFFIRDFTLEQIEFSFVEASNTISWTAGKIYYIDDTGANANRAISAGGPITWTSGTVFIYYQLGQTSFQNTTDITVALGADKAVMAVYMGGRKMIVNAGKVIISGADIIANSIGANQLVTATAVITVSAQIASLVVKTAQIDDLTVTTIKIAGEAVTTRVTAAGGDVTGVGTTETDLVTLASLTLATGEHLFLWGKCYIQTPSAAQIANLRLKRDTTQVDLAAASLEGTGQLRALAVQYVENVAGTYTIKLRGDVSTGTADFKACRLFAMIVRK